MDNLTHTLFGATLARTPLNRAGRGTTAALLLASNAPDIDIVTTVDGALELSALAPGTDARAAWHRRARHDRRRHRLVGQPPARPRPARRRMRRFRSLALVSIVGVLFHVLMDLPTSYGTRLLSPFDWHWFVVDLMPIVDIYLLAALAACFWFGSRTGVAAQERRHRAGR